jgi:hypothetical protein
MWVFVSRGYDNNYRLKFCKKSAAFKSTSNTVSLNANNKEKTLNVMHLLDSCPILNSNKNSEFLISERPKPKCEPTKKI